jgi:hypothetical protein
MEQAKGKNQMEERIKVKEELNEKVKDQQAEVQAAKAAETTRNECANTTEALHTRPKTIAEDMAAWSASQGFPEDPKEAAAEFAKKMGAYADAIGAACIKMKIDITVPPATDPAPAPAAISATAPVAKAAPAVVPVAASTAAPTKPPAPIRATPVRATRIRSAPVITPTVPAVPAPGPPVPSTPVAARAPEASFLSAKMDTKLTKIATKLKNHGG